MSLKLAMNRTCAPALSLSDFITLAQRVDGAPMPKVDVLDLRAVRGSLHPAAHEALVDSRKAIVPLNRRGWSNFLTCQDCGRAWICPNCDVTLVLHMNRGAQWLATTLMPWVADLPPGQPVNLIDAMLHPEGMTKHITNLEEVLDEFIDALPPKA